MATRYWVSSLPVPTSASSLWSRPQESISKHSSIQSNSFVEGVTHKVRCQIEEFERVSAAESNALTVDKVPVDSYLTRFVWDEAKYPTMCPLREIVDGIHVQVAKIEDDLKVRVAEYNNKPRSLMP